MMSCARAFLINRSVVVTYFRHRLRARRWDCSVILVFLCRPLVGNLVVVGCVSGSAILCFRRRRIFRGLFTRCRAQGSGNPLHSTAQPMQFVPACWHALRSVRCDEPCVQAHPSSSDGGSVSLDTSTAARAPWIRISQVGVSAFADPQQAVPYLRWSDCLGTSPKPCRELAALAKGGSVADRGDDGGGNTGPIPESAGCGCSRHRYQRSSSS